MLISFLGSEICAEGLVSIKYYHNLLLKTQILSNDYFAGRVQFFSLCKIP
jgi:hypothetical protein